MVRPTHLCVGEDGRLHAKEMIIKLWEGLAESSNCALKMNCL